MGRYFKDCGDENNLENLYGIHHNTSSWNQAYKKNRKFIKKFIKT